MTKNIVLLTGFISSLFVVLVAFLQDVAYGCYEPSWWCQDAFTELLSLIMLAFLPIVVVFFFSLLTYWAKEEVFRAWWSFARWSVPVIVVASFYTSAIDNAQRGSSIGDFSMSVVILVPIYTLFIITSLVSIVKAYLSARGK